MFKFGSKKIAVFTPIVFLLLVALMLPAVLTPATTEAQDVGIYALIQIPSQEKEDSLKSLVISVLDSRDSYAIIGCTLAQLADLPGNGYTVIEQCTGNEDQCLSQLATTLNSLPGIPLGAAPPVGGFFPSPFDYSFIDSNTPGGPDFYWIDIRGTGTNTGMHCDDCWVTVPVGFTFNFDGNDYTTISISANGYLTFGDDQNDWSNTCIPDPVIGDPNDSIYVFWDDLYSDCADSDIYYTTYTINGKTVFIVQWVGNQFCCGCPQPYRLNFEAILFQGSNVILFQYNSMTGGTRADGRLATVGLENIYGTGGLQYSCDSPTIANGLAILFCPQKTVTSTCVESADLTQQPPTQPKPGSSPSMPAATPALITVRNMNINPLQVSVGQPIIISANMANDGDQAGGYAAALKINGKTEETKIGAVDGHSAAPVSFTIFKSQPGTYTADIGGQQGTFTVLAAETSGPSASSGTIAIIVMLALIIITAVVLMLTFRRRSA